MCPNILSRDLKLLILDVDDMALIAALTQVIIPYCTGESIKL